MYQFDISYVALRRVKINEVATHDHLHVCTSDIIDIICRCLFSPIKDFIHTATSPAPSSHITMGQNFLVLIV